MGDLENVTAIVFSYILADLPNDFDPSVSGLHARVGAIVGTKDKAQSWHKIGPLDTDWMEVYGGA